MSRTQRRTSITLYEYSKSNFGYDVFYTENQNARYYGFFLTLPKSDEDLKKAYKKFLRDADRVYLDRLAPPRHFRRIHEKRYRRAVEVDLVRYMQDVDFVSNRVVRDYRPYY